MIYCERRLMWVTKLDLTSVIYNMAGGTTTRGFSQLYQDNPSILERLNIRVDHDQYVAR